MIIASVTQFHVTHSVVCLDAAPHLVDVESVPAALHEAGLGHQLGGAAPLEAVLPLGEEEGAVIRRELRVHKQLPGLRTLQSLQTCERCLTMFGGSYKPTSLYNHLQTRCLDLVKLLPVQAAVHHHGVRAVHLPALDPGHNQSQLSIM